MSKKKAKKFKKSGSFGGSGELKDIREREALLASKKVEHFSHPLLKEQKKASSRLGLMLKTALLVLSLCLIFFGFQKKFAKPNVLSANTQSVFKRELEKSEPIQPEITATAAIVVSLKSGKIYYAKNIDRKLPPASTTKILTALLAIKEFDLNEVVEVPEVCTKVEGSVMHLVAGEKINVESLLYGMLVSSAGDAACTLSVYKFSSGSFVAKMNTLATILELKNTLYSNVIGLDENNESQVSSARDLYLMTKEAMKNGVFRKIVGTENITVYSSDGLISHSLQSTNELMFQIPGSLGVKTGTTPQAKEVLVYAYQKGGDELLIVVMGSENRWVDTKKLLDFTLTNYYLK